MSNMNLFSSKAVETHTPQTSQVSRELSSAMHPASHSLHHPQIIATALPSPGIFPSGLNCEGRPLTNNEGAPAPIFPPARDQGRLPSVRSIFSGTEMRSVVPATEAQLYGDVRYPTPSQSGPNQSAPQRTSHGQEQCRLQPAVSTPGHVIGSVGNPPVSYQGQESFYIPTHPTYYRQPSYAPFRVDQGLYPMTREAVGPFPDHAVAPPQPMEPAVTPYYFMGPHMQVADARTPAVHINYPGAATSHQIPTTELPGPAGIENLATSTRAPPFQGDEQRGAFSTSFYARGGDSLNGVPEECTVDPRFQPAVGYGAQPPSAYQTPHDSQDDEGNTDRNWRYIVPGSARGEGLTSIFLSQVTAMPCEDEEGRLRCSECDEEFGNLPSWKRHASRSHRVQESTKVPCPICKIELRNEGNVKRHLKTVHKNVADPKVCSHCQATFSTDRARSIHVMRIHSIPAEIPVEGGVTKTRSRRGRTGPQAGKPKMHKCPNCEYVSRWKGNISRHVNSVHLELRQFPCGECTRRFNTLSNLSVHQMTHMREREQGG